MDFSIKYLYILSFKENINIKDKLKLFASFNKKNFKVCNKNKFHVIGLSHLIEIPSENYIELFSCENLFLENKNLIKFKLDNLGFKEFKLNHENRNIYFSCEILEFKNNFNLVDDFQDNFNFSKESITGFKYLNDGYKTIHTYPEINRIIITKTKFENEK